ncbi:disulfide bond formation protein B [Candidatus Parcubacteria bacterium]|nr:MAG: disulfide bond formation protein B [Candidatus Parcubacteria bacterium]
MNNINEILVFLTFLSQIVFVAGLISFFNYKAREQIILYIKKYGLIWAFVIALVATSGSLFYSEIMKFDPCKLCWYQRIFVYPQVFLLGLAIYKKEKAIVDYSLLLLLFGGLISLYHNYIYYRIIDTAFCETGQLATCTTKYIFEMGYITIPLMAMTSIILMASLLWGYKNSE